MGPWFTLVFFLKSTHQCINFAYDAVIQRIDNKAVLGWWAVEREWGEVTEVPWMGVEKEMRDFLVTKQDSVLTEYKGRELFWTLHSAFPPCFVRGFQADHFLPSAGLNTVRPWPPYWLPAF